ncbi:flagellar hook-associated protein FlgK [Bacillus thermotolerans]|uniref:flagellar hook-associated protein FlgK n=1 Tax=Bacillus thermotolerans TaxID=1221996 RepID=UPI00057DF403|nr:flagellar hook-associated protein FlgK [Bacillus thermotolerans]KKB35981.1 Flagellar hook-associated protein FlgK [Bacillus thermotolerans]
MRSTFHGLETAKRAMFAQQTAISTTGHNIANANTPGYTRQRVNFQQTEPYPGLSMNRPQIPGQMGTGVEAGSIERVRESFLDVQFRGENNKLGYWQARSESLEKMENILNEPSDSGLAAVMGQFWQSLQDLSVNPENEGARSVVMQRGQAVVDTFHYMHDSLSAIKADIGSQVEVGVKEINSILEQISGLNQQISEIEPNGYLPNDLYDERDRLVDQLSQHLNISVTRESTGGNRVPSAEGTYTITMNTANGPVELVKGEQVNNIGIAGGTDTDGDGLGDQVNGPLAGFTVAGQTIDVPSFSQGKLKAQAEAYGYGANGSESGSYPDMLDQLDQLAYTFGTLFNAVHGHDYEMTGTPAEGKTHFFELGAGTSYKGAASAIEVNATLDPKDIATSFGGTGDGRNAINLANVTSMILSESSVQLEGGTQLNISGLPIQNGTINSFYEGMIGSLGVDAQQAARMTKNSEVLTQTVETNRQSVSAVSLDEEMTNLIKFQHAYNAAARNITIVDEMLDRVINNMGVVGR